MLLRICGKAGRREFCELARDARSIAAQHGATTVETDGFFTDPTTRNVDFLLLLRSFPNEFNVADVERLRRAAPLAPIAMIAGELCEGEDRTGERFFGVRRFYSSEWQVLGRFEFTRFFAADGATGLFAESPLSPFFARRLARTYDGGDAEARFNERTLILSDNADLAETLVVALGRVGSTLRVASFERFDADAALNFSPTRIVIDAPGFIDTRLVSCARRLRMRYPLAALDVLTFLPDAPGTEDTTKFELWNQTRVWTKPFDFASFLRSYD
ncbi:MAG: hypothetical protein ACOX0A_01410 [Thermoguttaceae bacterium]|jgi:hypothetical protein